MGSRKRCTDWTWAIDVQTAHVQSIYHLSSPCHNIFCQCPLRIPLLLPMSSQYTTSTTHVQSIHHLSYQCQVITPSLLPVSPYLHAEYYFSCQCSVRKVLVLPDVQSVQHLFCPKFSQFIISLTMPAHVQSVHHVSCPHPLRV